MKVLPQASLAENNIPKSNTAFVSRYKRYSILFLNSRKACVVKRRLFPLPNDILLNWPFCQVLFDLPDFMIISTYTLLAVVWAEAFLQVKSPSSLGDTFLPSPC